MSNSLRSEIAEIIGYTEMSKDGFTDAAAQILNLIASKMPEKKAKHYKDFTGYSLEEVEQDRLQLIRDVAYDQAIDDVKSILKGGTV